MFVSRKENNTENQMSLKLIKNLYIFKLFSHYIKELNEFEVI